MYLLSIMQIIFLVMQTKEWVEPTTEAATTMVRIIRVSVFFPWKKWRVLDNIQNTHHQQQDGRLQWCGVIFLSASYRYTTTVMCFSSQQFPTRACSCQDGNLTLWAFKLSALVLLKGKGSQTEDGTARQDKLVLPYSQHAVKKDAGLDLLIC